MILCIYTRVCKIYLVICCAFATCSDAETPNFHQKRRIYDYQKDQIFGLIQEMTKTILVWNRAGCPMFDPQLAPPDTVLQPNGRAM